MAGRYGEFRCWCPQQLTIDRRENMSLVRLFDFSFGIFGCLEFGAVGVDEGGGVDSKEYFSSRDDSLSYERFKYSGESRLSVLNDGLSLCVEVYCHGCVVGPGSDQLVEFRWGEVREG